jgi:hypothetical protein
MYIQKRTVSSNIGDDFVQKPPASIEENAHKFWHRFVIERTVGRTYVPTAYGTLSFLHPHPLVNVCSRSNKTMECAC